MSNEKPSRNEEEYFAREDAERIQRLKSRELEAQRAAERKQHFMKCPKCGGTLETVPLSGIQIDRCPDCHGVWLDNGEIEQIMRHDDPGVIGRVFGDLWGTLRRKKGGA